ncbi:hypothetical protein ES705_27743 [subsurface metagenome]
MINFFKIHCLTLIGIIMICQFNFAQIETSKDPTNLEIAPIISGVHTLSVHVRDTISHDSVYQFLVHKLMLPVYYTPEKYGQRKYAGVYAGNMVLEPCGPYPNIDYAIDNFRSIFFGMNFEVYKSLASSEQALNNRDIKHQINKNSIYVRDSILCNENVFTALYEVRDKKKRDLLRNTLITNVKNKPGIEYIKEIFIGYKEEVNFLKWKEFLYPLEFGKNDVCQINDSLQIHFTRGNINEVKGITFKVKSLVEAKQYLVKNKLFTTASDKKIKLNQTQSFGLSIFFSDEE